MSVRRKSDPLRFVLGAAIRVDVRMTGGGTTTKGFATWEDACSWLASLADRAPDVSSVRLIHQAAQAGGPRPPRNNTNGDAA